MISRKLAFPSGAQKSVLRGTFGIKPRTRFADEKAGFYDRDARDYFARAGVKSELGKDQISRFVKGIKKLGLWNNMVCWPLRSSQNEGTGTTAYSLGGLGTFNGTLTNGPTWGTDGITLDGSNDYVSITFAEKSSYVNFNLGIVLNRPSSTGTRIALTGGDPTIQRGPVRNDMTDGLNGVSWRLPDNSFRFVCYNKASNTVTSFSNDGLSDPSMTSSVQMNSDPLTIGANATPEFFWLGKISFVHLLSVGLTASQNSSLYSLYKSTLGQGLGLP